MTREEIYNYLRTSSKSKNQKLFLLADNVRKFNVGDDIYLRMIIEFSNICNSNCPYCGLRKDNLSLKRYTMSKTEILETVKKGKKLGYDTVVLQSGEAKPLSVKEISSLINLIKNETGVAVTLSLGLKDEETLFMWKLAGADRYLLRFEDCKNKKRIRMLKTLKKLDYEVGSGFMVGLPGQTFEDLVNNLLLLKKIDVDMIGIGTYIPNKRTPFGNLKSTSNNNDQVKNSVLMTEKTLALARILCPDTNMPAATSLRVISKNDSFVGALNCGANVIMNSLTPEEYKKNYTIYPGFSNQLLANHIELTKRTKEIIIKNKRLLGEGPGASQHFLNRKVAYRYA